MNKPVIIVDPISAGIELAPAFNKRGIPAIAITPEPRDFPGFGTKIRTDDFIKIIPNQPNLIEIIRKYNPLAIIPGSDEGVELADHLAAIITPELSNDPKKTLHRRHKALMQQALQQAGVAHLKTLNATSEQQVQNWIEQNHLINSSLILKPPMSAGSDKVFHIYAKDDWKKAFKQIMTEPCKLTGLVSESVVVQEEAIGTEFAIGTVSANGKHYLAHLIKYTKRSAHGRKTLYDYVEFVPFTQELYGELFDYTQQVLDALGVRWGAAHTEIMLTDQGPRLIEIGTRMCGGPVVSFARQASGSSQADKLVELYVDGDVLTKKYTFKTSVVPVFLKSPATGIISKAQVFDKIFELPTLFKEYLWFKNGDHIAQTEDYLTSIGIVALTGDRESIFLDYQKIRDMESQLVIEKISIN